MGYFDPKMLKSQLLLLATLLILSGWMNTASSQEPTCCNRWITVLNTPMPKPQERDESGLIAGAINEVLADTGWGEESLDDCPMNIDIIKLRQLSKPATWLEQTLESDYVIQPSLTLKSVLEIVPGEWEEGYGGKPNYLPGSVRGDWAIRIALIDYHHGKTLRKVETSWTGSLAGDGQEHFYDLARKLMPVDDVIHKYERMPELCAVQPEKESIEAGQTMSVQLTDIVDSRMAGPQRWQRILVRAEKGALLNGYKKGDWSIFKADIGTITVEYKAPQVCEDEWEEIQVWNSCSITGGLHNTLPEKEIGNARFKNYDRKPEQLTVRPEPIKVKVGDSVSIQLTNIVDAEGKSVGSNEQLMVSVDKGRITNGVPLDAYTLFDVHRGTVDITYQAPNDLSVNVDNIKIYNLCVKDKPNRLIAERPITIEFPPLAARITRTLEQSRQTVIDSTEPGNLRKVRKGNSLSTKRVAIIASFSDDSATGFFAREFQMKHTKVHYRMVDCRVVSQTFSLEIETTSLGRGFNF